jgi:hypothetical protein
VPSATEVTAPTPVSEEGQTAPQEPPPPTTLPEAPPEAPPPPPSHHGLVLESRLGALTYLGQWRHEAPPSVWLYTQIGFELPRPFGWIMPFGYGELAVMSTSVGNDESHSIGFPVYGFGGGLRFTARIKRIAVFGQGAIGVTRADTPQGSLADLGFPGMETLSLSIGGRLGVEWYQVDRHMAIGLGVGVRDALGFKKEFGSDVPVVIDSSAALRYTF